MFQGIWFGKYEIMYILQLGMQCCLNQTQEMDDSGEDAARGVSLCSHKETKKCGQMEILGNMLFLWTHNDGIIQGVHCRLIV